MRRLLAVQQLADVVCRGRDHGLDHVAGLGRAARDGRDLHRRNRDAHAHAEDVLEPGVALVGVDGDEAARVGQAFDAEDRVHPLEGRQHHAVLEGQHVFLDGLALVVVLGHVHVAGFHLGGLGVADPLDVALAQGRFEHALGVADAAQAQVTDVGLGRHVGHGHLVADLAPAQVGVHDHRELVGRTETRRALHRAHHDGAGGLHELIPGGLGGLGVAHMADRLRVAAVRAQAVDFVERQLGAGGDDQVVVVHPAAVFQLDLVGVGVHPPGALDDGLNAFALECRGDVHLDVLALAPVHGHPGVGRDEMELGRLADHGDRVTGAGERLHFIGHGHAAEAGAQNDDVSHGIVSKWSV